MGRGGRESRCRWRGRLWALPCTVSYRLQVDTCGIPEEPPRRFAMPRCQSVTPHLATDEVERRYRACRDPVERSHWHIVWLVSQGHTCPTVARLTGYSETWLRALVHRYNADGLAGLSDRRHANPGQPPLVPPAVRLEDRRRAVQRPALTRGPAWPPAHPRWRARVAAARPPGPRHAHQPRQSVPAAPALGRHSTPGAIGSEPELPPCPRFSIPARPMPGPDHHDRPVRRR